MRAIDLAKLAYERRKRYFDNWRRYAEVVKRVAEAELGEVEVYVFGSVVRGEAHPALSDIDVLVVSPRMPESNEERARIRAKIDEELGPFNPFEVHLVSPREFEWYKRFIDEMVPI